MEAARECSTADSNRTSPIRASAMERSSRHRKGRHAHQEHVAGSSSRSAVIPSIPSLLSMAAHILCPSCQTRKGWPKNEGKCFSCAHRRAIEKDRIGQNAAMVARGSERYGKGKDCPRCQGIGMIQTIGSETGLTKDGKPVTVITDPTWIFCPACFDPDRIAALWQFFTIRFFPFKAEAIHRRPVQAGKAPTARQTASGASRTR